MKAHTTLVHSTRPADEVLPVGLHRFDGAAAAAAVDGFREIGDNCSLLVALDATAQMLEGASRLAEAEQTALEGRAVSAGFGMRGWECKMDTRLGSLAGRQGDRDRAESFCRAAVELARDLALPTAR